MTDVNRTKYSNKFKIIDNTGTN